MFRTLEAIILEIFPLTINNLYVESLFINPDRRRGAQRVNTCLYKATIDNEYIECKAAFANVTPK